MSWQGSDPVRSLVGLRPTLQALRPTLRGLLWAWILVAPAAGGAPARGEAVGPVPEALRTALKLDPFYQKHLDVEGLPVVGSAKVSDHALAEAAWIVRGMLPGRGDLLRAMGKNKVRLVVMAWNEYTTDVPEHRRLKSKVFWDRRARGLGGTPQDPAVSCGEENLLGYPGDPYATENILIHEFAHAIHQNGLRTVDPGFEPRLRAAYDNAKRRGLWPKTYAITGPGEYWAEGVQSWFDANRENDALHCHVNTRAELKPYDPELAKLCTEVFGDHPWRYRKPADRPASERAHLAGFDPARLPRFRWRDPPIPEKPRVLIQTALGDVEVELFPKQAPGTVANFLRYVHEGFYADGSFFRTMARTGPDTARDGFFICVGDQPELDFCGKRHADGQGFGAFGRVVRGMDVVRKIHASAAPGQELSPPVRIQRAIRLN